MLRGKLPVTKGGPGHIDAATWDVDELPAALEGWAGGLGLIPAEGLLVLDVDVKNGARGEETLAEWVAECGPLPITLECRTPSGGRHIWLRYAGPRPRGGDGIDVRTFGSGYVAVPPSEGYSWSDELLDQAPTTPSPTWQAFLARRAAAGTSSRRRRSVRRIETDAERATWNEAQEAALERALEWYRAKGMDA